MSLAVRTRVGIGLVVAGLLVPLAAVPGWAQEKPVMPEASLPEVPSGPGLKVEKTETPGAEFENATFDQGAGESGPPNADSGQPGNGGGQPANSGANNNSAPALAPKVPGCFIDAAGLIPCRAGGGGGVPATPEPVVDVMTVVGRALTAMHLDSPPMCFAPNIDVTKAVGVVGMYAWAWFCVTDLRESTVGPVHRTAAAPGVVVNATAVNTGVLINWGDGSLPTLCAGALLPFTPYIDAANTAGPPSGLMSPTCGHRIEKASTTEPGGVFRVTATSMWVVNWSAITPSGPMAGVIPAPLTSKYTMRIGEVQVLNGPPPVR